MSLSVALSLSRLRAFLRSNTGAGVLLLAAAVAAIVCANSDKLVGMYRALLHAQIQFHAGGHKFGMSFEQFVSDGLMAVFFLVVALEIKRELLVGELSSMRRALMPVLAALGGMAVPAGIFAFFNWGNAAAMNGWAVPVATDIAFSLAVLALLGTRVPLALRVFLTAIAVIDDMLAIAIIAVFYTDQLNYLPLMLSLAVFAAMMLMNVLGVVARWPYLVMFLLLWLCMLGSGMHATIAGVLAAVCVPYKGRGSVFTLVQIERSLQGTVIYVIMPLFAFVNAGLQFAGLVPASIAEPLTLGIALGLFVGKPVGICAACVLGRMAGMSLPNGCDWRMVFGLSLLCGIGFTVSLFIGLLAFSSPQVHELANLAKLGVLFGSLLSGCAGYAVLYFVLAGRNGDAAAPRAASA